MGLAGSGSGGQGVWISARHCPGCPSRKVSPPKTLSQQPPAVPSGWAGQALSLMSFLCVCHRPLPLPASGGISSLPQPQAPIYLRRLGVRVDCHLKEESKQDLSPPCLLLRRLCCAKMLSSYPTLCHPVDCSPPGSSVRGILQARTLEWVAIPFSRGSSRPRDRTRVS